MEKKTNKKTIYLLLILIILLGFALSFYNLDKESLWTDEIISLTHAQEEDTIPLILSVIDKELTPPGYFIILSEWINIFGTSEFSLRFLSVIFSIASIVLVYLLGTKIFNRKVGLIAALIFSTTMVNMVYTQEARNYSMFGFLVLLSSLIFVYLCTHKDKLSYFVGYIFVNLLALYINYVAFFVLFFHFLILLRYFNKKSLIKKYVVSLIAIFIIYIPGFQILFLQSVLKHSTIKEAFILRGIPLFLSNLGIFFLIIPLIIITAFFIIFIIVSKKFKLKIPSKRVVIFLILCSLIFIGTAHLFFLETTLRSFAFIRYTIFLFPFVCLIIAKVITMVERKRIQSLFLVGILLFNLFTLSIYYNTTTKAPWREAVQYMEENTAPDTLVLFDRSGSNINLFKYYSGTKFNSIMNLTWTSYRFVQIDEKKIFERLDKEDNFWLISSRNIKTGNYYKELLNKNYKLVLSKKFIELELYYYEQN